MSIAGGADKAIPRALELGCEAMQIFVKSPNQWRNKPRGKAEAAAFREAREAQAMPVVAHAGYLINLASEKEEVAAKSRDALLDELRRCEALGVFGLVLHPGAPQGAGREVGMDLVAAGLDAVLEGDEGGSTRILLENTAGQGSTLGLTVGELARITERTERRARLGVCLDTCHAFAAGYDLREEDGYERLVGELDESLGIGALACWHLNDSKFPLGRNRDRHANIGEGEIGRDAFARLLHDGRFADVPMILETPLGEDKEGHARDLVKLRNLA